MKPRLLVVPLLLLAALLLFAACGDDDDGGGAADGGTAEGGTAEGTAGAPDATPSGPRDRGVGEPGPDSPTIAAGTASAGVGAQAMLELQVTGFPEPGLGAWTIDIDYDHDILSVAACEPHPAAFCNPECGPPRCEEENTLRTTGAVARGLLGDILLATITFSCDAAGTVPVTVTLDVFADATPGDPTELAAFVEDGEVICTEGATGGPSATP